MNIYAIPDIIGLLFSTAMFAYLFILWEKIHPETLFPFLFIFIIGLSLWWLSTYKTVDGKRCLTLPMVFPGFDFVPKESFVIGILVWWACTVGFTVMVVFGKPEIIGEYMLIIVSMIVISARIAIAYTPNGIRALRKK